MTRFGSYDLALANPDQSLTDDAPCVCGHHLEAHEAGYNPGACQATAVVYGGELEPCACERFELDEEWPS